MKLMNNRNHTKKAWWIAAAAGMVFARLYLANIYDCMFREDILQLVSRATYVHFLNHVC
jgi:hypothetical protein